MRPETLAGVQDAGRAAGGGGGGGGCAATMAGSAMEIRSNEHLPVIQKSFCAECAHGQKAQAAGPASSCARRLFLKDFAFRGELVRGRLADGLKRNPYSAVAGRRTGTVQWLSDKRTLSQAQERVELEDRVASGLQVQASRRAMRARPPIPMLIVASCAGQPGPPPPPHPKPPDRDPRATERRITDIGRRLEGSAVAGPEEKELSEFAWKYLGEAFDESPDSPRPWT